MKPIHFVRYMNQLFDGIEPPPITLEIDLTNRCNFHCPHCTDEYLHNNAEMDADVIIETVKRAALIGTKSVVIKGGGEPTVHKNFSHIVEAISKDVEIGLVSNGFNLQEEKIRESIIQHCNWIRVSLDSATATTHSKIHGVGVKSYPLIISSLTRLNKERVGKKLTVGVNFCITDDNYTELFAAAKTVKHIGCDYISIRFAQIEGNKILSAKCFFESAIAIEKCKKLESDNFYINSRGSAEGFYWKRRLYLLRKVKHEWTDCVAPCLSAQILATGDVIPCCFIKPYNEFVYGNIKKKPFDKIWMSTQHKRVLAKVKKQQCEIYCRGRSSSTRFDDLNKVFSYLKNNKEPDFL